MRVCIVGASGKLGQYMVQHALDRGYEVVGVCRQESVGKLDRFKGRITVIPGATDDPEVIKRAVDGCDGVLVVMTPVCDAERPGAGRLDLHRRHHLWRRPQPARLHRRDDRRPRPGHGGRSPTAALRPA